MRRGGMRCGSACVRKTLREEAMRRWPLALVAVAALVCLAGAARAASSRLNLTQLCDHLERHSSAGFQYVLARTVATPFRHRPAAATTRRARACRLRAVLRSGIRRSEPRPTCNRSFWCPVRLRLLVGGALLMASGGQRLGRQRPGGQARPGRGARVVLREDVGLVPDMDCPV